MQSSDRSMTAVAVSMEEGVSLRCAPRVRPSNSLLKASVQVPHRSPRSLSVMGVEWRCLRAVTPNLFVLWIVPYQNTTVWMISDEAGERIASDVARDHTRPLSVLPTVE